MDEVIFFFQAEDGIRDSGVTGVQTCALPIYRRRGASGLGRDVGKTARHRDARGLAGKFLGGRARNKTVGNQVALGRGVFLDQAEQARSEERRVGKGWRTRWAPYHLKKKKQIT